VASLQEAIEFIAANKTEAARIYAETARVKQPEAETLRSMIPVCASRWSLPVS
jgi:hypothetical protein